MVCFQGLKSKKIRVMTSNWTAKDKAYLYYVFSQYRDCGFLLVEVFCGFGFFWEGYTLSRKLDQHCCNVSNKSIRNPTVFQIILKIITVKGWCFVLQILDRNIWCISREREERGVGRGASGPTVLVPCQSFALWLLEDHGYVILSTCNTEMLPLASKSLDSEM